MSRFISAERQIQGLKILGLLFLTLQLTTACGPPSYPRTDGFGAGIVHGKDVTKKEKPAKSVVALVIQRENGEALCTGSLLAPDLVLTAAHCVDEDPIHVVIVFGLNVKATPKENARIADQFLQNPAWHHPTKKGEGDLALVHFPGGLPAGYEPVQLAPKDTNLAVGTEVLLMGYGVTSGETQQGAGVLREALSQVSEIRSGLEVVTDGHQRNVCFGDSGGPVFLQINRQWVQWGVASAVSNQACNENGIHTNLNGYKNWIQSTSLKMQK